MQIFLVTSAEKCNSSSVARHQGGRKLKTSTPDPPCKMKTNHPVPPQSRRVNVRHPGITRAAVELGVHRGHLHRVLIHERKSKSLLTRWHAWLRANPEYARIKQSIETNK